MSESCATDSSRLFPHSSASLNATLGTKPGPPAPPKAAKATGPSLSVSTASGGHLFAILRSFFE